MSDDASLLLKPFRLGDLELKNRVAMAPLTRMRASEGTDAPNDLNAEYYRQRATAGLIIAEATQVSQQGQGYIHTPGIYTPAQVDGWQKVTRAVHEEGGHIFLQLWHVGRISHVSLQPGAAAPVAPSALQAKTKTRTADGPTDVSMPRALETAEIPGIVEDFRRAAENAKQAGFDGVEIHGANGYLLDQFFKDGANHRSDAYGGSIENRARFPLEVVDAVLTVWDKQRVGIRLGPVTPANGITISDPNEMFFYLVREFDARGLGFIHVIEGATGGPRDNVPFDYAAFRKSFRGAYIANNGYTRDMAIEALRSDAADLIAFGRPYISNPDLVARLARNAPLAEPDKATIYGRDSVGYTDYPMLQGVAAE